MEALQSRSGNPRFPYLDGIGGLAALMFVVYRCAILWEALPTSGAAPVLARLNAGMVVFFVLSGFLLYRPFVAAQHGQGPAPRLRDDSTLRERLTQGAGDAARRIAAEDPAAVAVPHYLRAVT